MNLRFELDRLILLTSSALFDEDYTVGQEGLISGLKDKAGVITCYVISAIGFIIVAAAIIKNALAGLYLAYPKLWDKVHMVREQMENGLKTASQGGEKWKKVGGSIMMILISILPDVKDATEFGQDENGQNSATSSFEKKQWLLKAIPEFLALVMIGMLIFYGYPTKLANWVGSTGRFALDALFDNVDPVQFTKNVFDGIATYELATDSATSSSERNINAITRSAVKQIYTRYSDMHSQPLQQTATLLEQDILHDFACVVDLSTLLEEPDGMTVSYAVQLTATTPNINAAFTDVVVQDGATLSGNMKCAISNSGVKQYKYWVPASKYPTGSTKVGDTDYILITVNATPKSQTIVNSAKVTYMTNCLTKVGSDASKWSLPNTVKFNLAEGIYITNGAPVVINVYTSAGVDQYNGTITYEGVQGYISLTATRGNQLDTSLTSCKYVEILLPEKSYTMYETVNNGAAITSKVSVMAIRCMKESFDGEGWINASWTDYSTVKKGVPTLSAHFFESKSSDGSDKKTSEPEAK